MAVSTPLLAAIITVVGHTNFLTSIVLFFIVPSVYFTFRRRSIFRKGMVLCLASIPFTVIIDYFAMADGSWYDSTIFPYRLLNGIPLEDFLWSAAWFYFVIAIYETFIDRSRKLFDSRPNPRFRTLLLGWLTAGTIFLLLYPLLSRFVIPYFYAVFVLGLGLIPVVIFLSHYPKLWHKFSVLAVYMFFVSILHEISALTVGQWYFPGQHFIGWVQFFDYRFPLEELILWMMLGSTYVVTWYEYFVDDQR